MSLRFAALGIDHRHIFGMAANMQAEGAEFAGFWTEGTPETLPGFEKRFPEVPRIDDKARLIEDASLDLILIAAVPGARAALAIEALRAGRDLRIIELIGVSSEATHMYAPSLSVWNAWRVTLTQWRTAWRIGAAVRAQGTPPPGPRALLRALFG